MEKKIVLCGKVAYVKTTEMRSIFCGIIHKDDPEIKKLAMIGKIVPVDAVCGKIVSYYSS